MPESVDDFVIRCPYCHNPYIYYRKTLGNYRCLLCEKEFDEPFIEYKEDPELDEIMEKIRKKEEEIEVVLQKAKVDYSKCVICGCEADHVHHINLDREDERFDNLAPLCRECHGYIHGSMNAVFGDLASMKEAMTILVDSKIKIMHIYLALVKAKNMLFNKCEIM